MADYSPAAAENYPAHQVRKKRNIVEQRGMNHSLIDRHRAALETAIRHELEMISLAERDVA